MKLLPTCKDVEARLTDFSEGALPFQERMGIRLHLLICLACRAMYRGLSTLPWLSRRLLIQPSELPTEALEALRKTQEHIREISKT